MLTYDQIAARIGFAFPPLPCSIQIHDYGAKLRFKVFDENGRGIISIMNAPLRRFRNEKDLENILEEVRGSIRKKGYKLN
jgi:hypothetical protein